MKQPGNGLCVTLAKRFLIVGREASCMHARGVCHWLGGEVYVKWQVHGTMASWTLMVFTSSYRRKPEPCEMKLYWKIPEQNSAIMKAFTGASALLLYAAGWDWLQRWQEERDAPPQEERLRAWCMELTGEGPAGAMSAFPSSWLVSVETFFFSLLLHITLIFEKILPICLVAQTLQKGKCFNMLALLEEAKKEYGGQCQIWIIFKIKLFQLTKELVFEYQGTWRTQLMLYFVLSVLTVLIFVVVVFPW